MRLCGRNFSIGIEQKLIIHFAVASLVPILLICFIAYSQMYDKTIETAKDHISSLANSQKSRLTHELEEERRILLIIANQPSLGENIKRYMSAKNPKNLSAIQELVDTAAIFNNHYESTSVILPSGEVLACSSSAPTDCNYVKKEIFEKAKSQTVMNGFYINKIGGVSLLIGTPIVVDGEIVAVLMISVDTTDIAGVSSDYTGLGLTGETVIAKSEESQAVFVVPLRKDKNAALKRKIPLAQKQVPIVRALLNIEESGVVGMVDYAGSKVIYASRYVSEFDMGLVVKIDETELYASARKASLGMLAAIGLCVLFSVFLSILFARTISSPIVRLTQFARDIKDGNLKTRNDVKSDDEIGELAGALNETVEALDILTEHLEEKVDERTTELEETNQELQESKAAIEAILDFQENLLIVVEHGCIIHANRSFLEFFGCLHLDNFSPCKECFCHRIMNKNFSCLSENCHNWLSMVHDNGGQIELFDTKTAQERVFLARTRPFPGNPNRHIVSLTDITPLHEERLHFEHLSEIDGLTGIYNRAKFDSKLDIEVQRSKRYSNPLSLIMFDIDHFKAVNDEWGHQKGDNVLRRLAAIVRENIRASDAMARYGGEEFTVIAPDTTLDGAVSLAQKIREQIELANIEGINVTCSFGVSQFDEQQSAEAFLRKTDAMLYRAKENGRNRVEF